MEDTSEIEAGLARAFPGRPMPDTTLAQGVLADQSIKRQIGVEEMEAAKKTDGGIAWDALTDTQLLQSYMGLAHLDEDAFVYYLPAFLRYAVRHIDSGNDVRLFGADDAVEAENSSRFGVENVKVGRLSGSTAASADCCAPVIESFNVRIAHGSAVWQHGEADLAA